MAAMSAEQRETMLSQVARQRQYMMAAMLQGKSAQQAYSEALTLIPANQVQAGKQVLYQLTCIQKITCLWGNTILFMYTFIVKMKKLSGWAHRYIGLNKSTVL